jgi:protein dithiol oxidoreductase (disulfide-forming)
MRVEIERMKRYLLPLSLFAALLLSACDTKKDETATSDAGNSASTATDAETLAAAEAAAKASTDPNAPMAADPSAAADPNAAAATPSGPTQAIPGLNKGTDYLEIKNGKPFEPLAGKIEVVEVFNFVCPACASFQPTLAVWKKNLPADVRFTYVPAAFGGNWDQYVRSYYTAQAMGIAEKAHDATYDAIHFRRTLKGERGEDSDQDLAKFYAQFGVDAKQFANNMRSFAVTAKFAKAKQFIIEGQIGSTPSVVINGKYIARGRSHEDVVRIADMLIAHERSQASGASATP